MWTSSLFRTNLEDIKDSDSTRRDGTKEQDEWGEKVEGIAEGVKSLYPDNDDNFLEKLQFHMEP